MFDLSINLKIMKKLMLMLTFVVASLCAANAQVNQSYVAGSYTGNITKAVMNGTDVMGKFSGQQFTFSIVDKGGGNYALSGKLDFMGGPAHHVIDFSDQRVIFTVDESGNIEGSGLGHITVTALLIKWMNKDFDVRPIEGKIDAQGHLTFSMKCFVHDSKYTAEFAFDGQKVN